MIPAPSFARMGPGDSLVEAALEGSVTEIAWLLENGADPKSVSRIPMATSAIGAAARSCSPSGVDALQLLLLAGAAPDGSPAEPIAPIVSAVRSGGPQAEAKAMILAAWGASPESRDEEGRSVLSWAADNGMGALAKLLVRLGADPHASEWGPTPLELCDEETGRALRALRPEGPK